MSRVESDYVFIGTSPTVTSNEEKPLVSPSGIPLIVHTEPPSPARTPRTEPTMPSSEQRSPRRKAAGTALPCPIKRSTTPAGAELSQFALPRSSGNEAKEYDAVLRAMSNQTTSSSDDDEEYLTSGGSVGRVVFPFRAFVFGENARSSPREFSDIQELLDFCLELRPLPSSVPSASSSSSSSSSAILQTVLRDEAKATPSSSSSSSTTSTSFATAADPSAAAASSDPACSAAASAPTPPQQTCQTHPGSRAPVLWLHMEGENEAALQLIGERFQLHPLTIEDLSPTMGREKIEVFPSYVFFHIDAVQTPSDRARVRCVQHGVQTSPVRVVVFSDCILSFCDPDVRALALIRQRVATIFNNSIESTAWLVHAMLDTITDAMIPVVEASEHEADNLEDLISALDREDDEYQDLLKRISRTRRQLGLLRQRLWSKRDIMITLINRDWKLFMKDVSLNIPYLRDVFDHVATMLEKVESTVDSLRELQSTYLANVSIDQARASNQLGRTMKVLTSVATIMMPLTFVTGIFGMNVKFPGMVDQGDDLADTKWPFTMICLTMGIIAAMMISIFKWKNLL